MMLIRGIKEDSCRAFRGSGNGKLAAPMLIHASGTGIPFCTDIYLDI